MIIAIWGRQSTGKSILANELGRFYSEQGKLAVVIDTDMTQPTLTPRLAGVTYDDKYTLGEIFSAPFIRDPQVFFHKDPKSNNLFFAGLLGDDDYLSYEIGMKHYEQAKAFVQSCEDMADIVILDLSSQRQDPFIAAATQLADCFVITQIPDAKNACWVLATKPLLEKKAQKERKMIKVGSIIQKHHSVQGYEALISTKLMEAGLEKGKALEYAKLEIEFPYSRHIHDADGRGETTSNCPGHAAKVWRKQLNILADLMGKE